MSPERSGPRLALVTGANRGIGLATARALALAGHRVALTGRDEHHVHHAAEHLAADGVDVLPYTLDVTDPNSITSTVAQITADHGPVGILINNAAVAIDHEHTSATPQFDRVEQTLDTNLLGAWRCATAVIPGMRQARWGRIVNVTSHLSLPQQLGAGSPAYRVSKTALNALTVILADDLRATGILVNAYSPGIVATRMGRPGHPSRTPEQAADTAVWLANLPDNGPTGRLWFNRTPLPW